MPKHNTKPSIANQPRNTGTQLIHTSESFEGPFPHPVVLQKFEEVLPGAAERIFQFSEREQKHRHQLELTQIKAITSDVKASTFMDIIGRVFGMLFLCVTFFISVYCAIVEKNYWIAGMFFSPSLINGLLYLIQGRKRKELEKT